MALSILQHARRVWWLLSGIVGSFCHFVELFIVVPFNKLHAPFCGNQLMMMMFLRFGIPLVCPMISNDQLILTITNFKCHGVLKRTLFSSVQELLNSTEAMHDPSTAGEFHNLGIFV